MNVGVEVEVFTVKAVCNDMTGVLIVNIVFMNDMLTINKVRGLTLKVVGINLETPWAAPSQYKVGLSRYGISTIKIGCSWNRPIFIIGILLVIQYLCIENPLASLMDSVMSVAYRKGSLADCLSLHHMAKWKTILRLRTCQKFMATFETVKQSYSHPFPGH